MSLTPERRKEIMDRAEEYWTEEEHIDQLVEEGLELALSIMHGKRDKSTFAEILSEMADVSIMIDRFHVKYGEMLRTIKDEKLLKVEALMDQDGK